MNTNPFRLRPGDVIEMDGKPCPIVRVTESAAVVAVAQPWREFTTLAGKRVQLQPAPKLVRISPNSDCPILNR
jgi:hypothetical protein